MNNMLKNFKGKRFGMLVCLKFIGMKKRHSYYICICDCGKKKEIRSSSLVSGQSKSCGCKRRRKTNYKYGDEPAFYRIYSNYKTAARLRKLSFELSQKEFRKFIMKNCFYCNKKPKNKMISENGKYICIYNGIYRVNNKIGYELNNCVSCCKACNLCKCDVTLNIINKAYFFLNKRKIKNVAV